jgi:hypothetical protein
MEDGMQGYIQGTDRQQTTPLPECRDDWIHGSNPVRAVDVIVYAHDLRDQGFEGVVPEATGRRAYPGGDDWAPTWGHLRPRRRGLLLEAAMHPRGRCLEAGETGRMRHRGPQPKNSMMKKEQL